MVRPRRTGDAESVVTVDVKARHEKLHRSLDELFACFIAEHPDRTNFLGTTLKEFIEWSHSMTIKPTCEDKHGG